MFHSGSGTHYLRHRRRTMAQCRWLCISPHSTLLGAVTRLSYPEAPGFPRCRLRQVSPCSPHASLHAHQPSCAANVAPFQYAPSVGLSTHFHSQPGHQAISCRMPFHGRPTYLFPLPGDDWSLPSSQSRREIGSNGGISPPSAQRSRTSPIRGMRLQHLLD